MSQPDRATRAQVVAINAQFTYMGYRTADRPERLAACAALLGLAELRSTNDLTERQAGQLVRMLSTFQGRDEVWSAAAASRARAEALSMLVAFALCVGIWWSQRSF